MTERDHGHDDDTERLPDIHHTHQYAAPGGPEPRHAPFSSSSYPPPSEEDRVFFGQPAPDTRKSGLGNGLVTGLVVAALVVGGLSGVAGAAGFTALDHAFGGSSSPVVSSSVTSSRAPATTGKDSVEAVARKVLPSVVKINVSGSQGSGSGSGIIIASDGTILTNNHVVALAGRGGKISVNFNDGTAKPATVVGTDQVTDLAVIKVSGVSGLTPATIGDSDNLQVGEPVVAIGSPYGLQSTVTSGIVSALNRPVSVGESSSTDTTYPAIQTDAAINPGNSGGPLVDMNGDVIGIDSSIRTASSGVTSQGGSIGLGFAIPITDVWPVVNQLRNGQTPTHARLGVSVTDASSSNGLLTGAGIDSVVAGSAAQKAGLHRGDVITKVDNDLISGSESLVATIRGFRPGDTVSVTYFGTDKQTHTVRVTLDSDGGAATS